MKSTLVALTCLLVLAGCSGGDDETDTPGSPEESGSTAVEGSAPSGGSDQPACSEVWVAGQTLPADYGGLCQDGDRLELAVTFPCKDGGGDLTGYQDRYWARLGGEIFDSGARDAMPQDPDYAADFEACTGE